MVVLAVLCVHWNHAVFSERKYDIDSKLTFHLQWCLFVSFEQFMHVYFNIRSFFLPCREEVGIKSSPPPPVNLDLSTPGKVKFTNNELKWIS